MVRRNNQTNRLIMWAVIAVDFILLNIVIFIQEQTGMKMRDWNWEQHQMFFEISNVALLIAEWKYRGAIHERIVSAGEILQRASLLTLTQVVIAYILMRHIMFWMGAGWLLIQIGIVFWVSVVFLRLAERNIIKYFRRVGWNTRTVTFIGNNKELSRVYNELMNDPTKGYRMLGYYADSRYEYARIPWLGTLRELLEKAEKGQAPELGDELYVSLSRKDKATIRRLSQLCDSQVTRFFYVPVSVETLGLNLQREYLSDVELFTTHESPLESVVNRALKRAFDIVIALVALALTGLLMPIIYIVIKLQSPGPIFFKQLRTGMDGKEFYCYKFRSMHVNKDADKLQATKDDPRKFPFGNLMRKTNLDEFPQFWNVLKGDMSVIGPRPHMLAHTEQYSHLIREYMVRHFVKPGVTGWAQVTGYRGETKELWQMEERVRRDIWYIENWSIWLDILIVWLTFKTFFVHDKNAY